MSEIYPTIPRKYHASMQIYKFLVVKERQEERKKSKSYTRIRWDKNWNTTLKLVLAFRITLISLATVVQCHRRITIHICEQSAVLHALAIHIYINWIIDELINLGNEYILY